MSAKRPAEEAGDSSSPAAKKPRHGFRVGPDNLPDGPWRRKVTKIKKDLIVKAKVKKQYAKIKAQYEQEQEKEGGAKQLPEDGGEGEGEGEGENDDPSVHIHPERQAMLDGDNDPAQSHAVGENDASAGDHQRGPRGRRQRRPGYFDKELAQAQRKKDEAEARAKEIAERQEEKKRRLAERERYRKAMAKAKMPGLDGKRKLGRESKLLLDKVKRVMTD